MQINNFRSKCKAIAIAAGIIMSAASGSAIAFDPEKTFKPDEEPRTILRYGFQALKRGDMANAVGAFRFGAKKNDLASQWKLARMLQTGTGVEQNHYAAFKLFAQIASRFADHPPSRRERGFVSHSVVSIGKYSLTGISGSPVKASARRAEDQFYRAAALYHDPEAQYELGKLYRSETLGAPRPKSAARWLGLAARKGHSGAQAELGEMLFYGKGVPRRPVRGLVYMTKAAANSARKDVRKWRKMQRAAVAKSTGEQIKAARTVLAKLKFRNDQITPELGFAPAESAVNVLQSD